jgi:DNA-binding transcriptional LysR family regulator
VSRAAQLLNLSQPAISHALGRLREHLGDPLFVRKGQKLVPTPLARKLIGPVHEALQLFEHTLESLDEFDPAAAQMHFSLGMRSLMESTFLLPLVLILKDRAPMISVSCNPYERRRIEPTLATGELNAVIDVFLPVNDELRRAHLLTASSVVVARRGHPLVDGTVDLDTYLSADHVCVTSTAMGQGPEDIALSRLGKSRNISVRCQQIHTAMRLVSMSDVLLTMSESFARRANLWFDHQILPTPFEAAPIDMYLYWHANADLDPANVWFRDMIKAALLEAVGPINLRV